MATVCENTAKGHGRVIPVGLFCYGRLAIRCAFVFAVTVKPIAGADSVIYKETAHNIRSEGVHYSGEGYAFRPPVYSYFIAAVYAVGGESDRSLFLAQAVIGAISAVLLYSCLHRWSMIAGVLASAFFSVHPLMLFYTEQALTEFFTSCSYSWQRGCPCAIEGGPGWYPPCAA